MAIMEAGKNEMKTKQQHGEKLKRLYKEKLLPLEKHCKFHELVSAELDDSFFDTKPVVLLIGQYSTGKTTFIRNYLGVDFPGMQIGREPTTDKFTIVLYNTTEGLEPGNTLIRDLSRYRSLTKFGENFLSHFQCARVPNELLKEVTFIDTPGVLSRKDQSIKRGYDFIEVLNDLGILADRIIFMFDPDKLDIAEELERTLQLFKKFPRKCIFILNKVDNVNVQKIFNALLWNLGQVVKAPEVPEVFVGYEGSHVTKDENIPDNIPNKPFPISGLAKFSLEKEIRAISRKPELLSEKLNCISLRTRKSQVLADVIEELQKGVPSKWKFWIPDKNEEALKSLDRIYNRALMKFRMNAEDLNIEKLRSNLRYYDLRRDFKPISKVKEISEGIDQLITNNIPDLDNEIKGLGGSHHIVETGDKRPENSGLVRLPKSKL